MYVCHVPHVVRDFVFFGGEDMFFCLVELATDFEP